MNAPSKLLERVRAELCWPHPALMVGAFCAMLVAKEAGFPGIATLIAIIVGVMAGERDASRRVTKALLQQKED